MTTSFILLLLTALVSVVGTKLCYWNSPSPYKYFGGKTLYDDVRGDIRHVTELHGCEPISVWLLSRHGSRNPGVKNLDIMKQIMTIRDEIVKNHADGKGELCDQDVFDLAAWKWNVTIDATPYFLTSRGYRELRELGSRINETFYTLLKDLHVHYIRAGNEQRTVESAKSFFSGLDETFGYKIQEPLKQNEDFVLLPFSNCERYITEIWLGYRLYNESQKYYRTDVYKQVVENLQRRIGLAHPLSATNISGLYDLCRFHRAYSDTSRSPWCSIFSTEDLEVLEYEQDISHYVRSGYGHPINAKLGGMVLKDLFEKFQDAADGKPSFTAYFSYDSLIDMVYASLGLFRDEESLSAEKRIPFRKWRSSMSTPFAANILAVLYNCTEPVDSSPYRVQFFANEKNLKVCDEACSWSAFENKFTPFLNSSLDHCKVGAPKK